MFYVQKTIFKLRGILFIAVLVTTGLMPVLSTPNIAHATDTVLRKGADWLDGGGVDVYQRPGDDSVMCVSVARASGGSGCAVGTVRSGTKWQCVEMVNRLYLTKAWTTTTWSGNGNTLVNSVPSGLTKEDNNSISFINPGDVITLDDDGYGHAAIVNSIVSSGGHTTVNIVNQNTQSVDSSAYIQNGSFADSSVHLEMNGWSTFKVQSIVHRPADTPPPAPTDHIVKLVGGAMYARASLNDAWSLLLATGASDVQAANGRFAYRAANGDLYAKDGLSGSWGLQGQWVDQYVLTKSGYIVKLTGGAIYARKNLNDSWSLLLASGATDIQAAATRFAYRTSNHNLYAKDDLGGAWGLQGQWVDQYTLTASGYIVKLSGGAVYARQGLSDNWSLLLASGAADISAAGNRLVYRTSDHTLYAKETLGGSWGLQGQWIDQYVVTDSGYIMKLTGGAVYARQSLNDSWSLLLSGGASDINAAGTRFAYRTSAHDLYAKETLGGSWGLQGQWVDQYGLSGN